LLRSIVRRVVILPRRRITWYRKTHMNATPKGMPTAVRMGPHADGGNGGEGGGGDGGGGEGGGDGSGGDGGNGGGGDGGGGKGDS